MQITESIIERIARKVFNAMFPLALRNSGASAGNSGGSGGSVQHAVEADHATTADSATSASSVPWTGVTNKPNTATRWPTWSEVTDKPLTFAPSAHTHTWSEVNNKPDTATRWPTWSEVTNKPYSKSAWGQTYLNGSSEFQNISGNMTNVGNISFDQSGRNIGGIAYFDTANSRLGIGTSNPSYKLHVDGTIYATGAITERSDIRCKDVETYQWAPSLDMIANAPIIRYSMKDDETHRMRVGSVAQYWQKVMPETVSEDNDGILSIAQGDICMVGLIAMAREIKQLKAKIERLEHGCS